MSYSYDRPWRVSPLIRAARYWFLITGIMYGITKQKVYEDMEAECREEEARLKVIKDKELACLKKKIAREEMESVRQLETGEMFAPKKK